MKYTLFHTDGKARRGQIENPRGVIDTPAFMPVGTVGSVRSVSPQEVAGTGAQIILGNTFHLMLRPGTEIINLHGSLHDFMGWSGPILTDSGGFQVWSLAKKKDIREEGVTFRSPVDGSTVFLDPEISMKVQKALGSDIVCALMSARPIRQPWMKRVSLWNSHCAGRSDAGIIPCRRNNRSSGLPKGGCMKR